MLKVLNKSLEIRSRGELDIVDITQGVSTALEEAGLKDGVITVFVPGATGGVTTIEYESGVLHDFPAMLERIAPRGITYEHELRWHDGNGHSHVRASLVGPSLTVPFREKRMTLGTWQQIAFVDFDNRPRRRSIILQIMGE